MTKNTTSSTESMNTYVEMQDRPYRERSNGTRIESYDEYGFRNYTPGVSLDDTIINTRKQQSNNKKRTIYLVIGGIIFVGFIISCILSGFIAWNCYANNLTTIRFGKTTIATIFPYLYLPYFFILRVILQQPCL